MIVWELRFRGFRRQDGRFNECGTINSGFGNTARAGGHLDVPLPALAGSLFHQTVGAMLACRNRGSGGAGPAKGPRRFGQTHRTDAGDFNPRRQSPNTAAIAVDG